MIMWSVMAAGGPWSRLHACLPLAIYRISRIALISSLLDKLSVNGDLGVLLLDWSTSSDTEYGRHSILDSSPQTFKGPALAKMAAVGFNPSTNDLAATQPTLMPSAMVPREKTKRPQLSCNPCRQRKVKVGIASSSTATGRSDNHRSVRSYPTVYCVLSTSDSRNMPVRSHRDRAASNLAGGSVERKRQGDCQSPQRNPASPRPVDQVGTV